MSKRSFGKGSDNMSLHDIHRTETILIQKPYKCSFTTKAIAEEKGRAEYLRASIVDFFIYVLLLTATITYSFKYKSSTRHTTHLCFYEHFIMSRFPISSDRLIKPLTFFDIKSVDEMLKYFKFVMLDKLYDTDIYDPEINKVREAEGEEIAILHQNRLLGVPRIRQVRAKNISCKIYPNLQKRFKFCYFDATVESQDTSKIGDGGEPFLEFQESEGPNYKGITKGSYPSGGFVQLLTLNKTTSLEKIDELQRHRWISRRTRFIVVNFNYYNANTNNYCVCSLYFEMPRIGGVFPNYSLEAISLPEHLSLRFFLELVPLVILVGLEVLFIIEEIMELIYFKTRYFFMMWTYVDVTQIVIFLMFIYNKYFYYQLNDVVYDLNPNILTYVNMEYLADYCMKTRNWFGIYMFLSYMKFFKFLDVFKAMRRLQNALRKSIGDLVNFFVMFLVIFFAFAEAGYLLFGNQTLDFREFTTALFALFRTVLGDFNYKTIKRENPYLAPVFMILFVFFILFVLVNMYMAIINEGYADVKTETAIAPDELEIWQYLKMKFLNCFRCVQVKRKRKRETDVNIKLDDLKKFLLSCGFNSHEIEEYIAKFHASRDVIDLKKLKEAVGDDELTVKTEDQQISPPVSPQEFFEHQEKIESLGHSVIALTDEVSNLLKRFDQLKFVHTYSENPS